MCSAALFSSCTDHQLGGVMVGGSLGGMFGSCIGGASGGWYGHHTGGAIGTVAGAMLGAAVTAPQQPATPREGYAPRGNSDGYTRDGGYAAAPYDEVDYATYPSATYSAPSRHAAATPWQMLEVVNARLVERNENRALDAGEHAFLTMEIYNRSGETLYNVAPQITCDNRKIIISPPALVGALPAGEGFRYRAEVIAPRRLRDGYATFTIAFGEGKARAVVKTFRVRTTR